MGRPRKNIDPREVENLAAIDCSYAEMAAVLGCNASTLTRRFAQAIQNGRARGCASLKRTQFSVAVGRPATYDAKGNLLSPAREPNPTMLIWLGKIRLRQVESLPVPIGELNGMSDEQLTEVANGEKPNLKIG